MKNRSIGKQPILQTNFAKTNQLKELMKGGNFLSEDALRLVRSGADADTSVTGGYSLLYFLIVRQDINAITELVEELGADVHIEVNHQTPLQYAISRGFYKTAMQLVHLGADPDTLVNGFSFLHFLVANKDIDAIKELREVFKADIHIQDSNHQTPLQYAISRGFYKIAMQLVHLDADPNSLVNGFPFLLS